MRSFNLSLEDYTGGSRVKNIQVKICGLNKFLAIISVEIDRKVKRDWHILKVEKSKLSSTASKTIDSF